MNTEPAIINSLSLGRLGPFSPETDWEEIATQYRSLFLEQRPTRPNNSLMLALRSGVTIESLFEPLGFRKKRFKDLEEPLQVNLRNIEQRAESSRILRYLLREINNGGSTDSYFFMVNEENKDIVYLIDINLAAEYSVERIIIATVEGSPLRVIAENEGIEMVITGMEGEIKRGVLLRRTHSSPGEEVPILQGQVHENLNLEMLKTEFLAGINKEQIKSNLRNLSLKDEQIEEELKNEERFVTKVLAAVLAWNKEEKDPVIMWDVDETMGVLSLFTSTAEWLFRPYFLKLVAFIKEKFPRIKMGILSSRPLHFLQFQLQEEKCLKSLKPYLGDQFIRSSEDSKELLALHRTSSLREGVNPEQVKIAIEIEHYIMKETGIKPSDRLNKLIALGILRAAGTNAKLIDDLNSIDRPCLHPIFAGDNVLSVEDVTPIHLNHFRPHEDS